MLIEKANSISDTTLPHKIKLVISDFHIADGQKPGEMNCYEDFNSDYEFADFLRYYSTDQYGGSCNVELIINGDFFDLLMVSVNGEFPTVITENIGIEKIRKVIQGHSVIFKALSEFISKPLKTITYLPGNHDPEMLFPECQKLFRNAISNNHNHQAKIRFHTATTCYRLIPERIEIHHGYQFEANHFIQEDRRILTDKFPEPIINLPWGSVFILKVINRLKSQRPYIDHIYPFRLYLLGGLFLDTRNTIKVIALSVYYFLKTRIFKNPVKYANPRQTLRIIKEEVSFFGSLEKYALKILKKDPALRGVIFGHSHFEKYRVYPNGVYINTGTWIKRNSLSLHQFGEHTKRSYALIEYDEKDKPIMSLKEWIGFPRPVKDILY